MTISPDLVVCFNWIHDYLNILKTELTPPSKDSLLFDSVLESVCVTISEEWVRRIQKRMYKYGEAQQLMVDIFNGLLRIIQKFSQSSSSD